MPLYQYRCPHCDKLSKYIAEKPTNVRCKDKKCAWLLTPENREFADTSSNCKEVIDNGIMPRKVENFANANEMLQDRNHVVNTKREKNDL